MKRILSLILLLALLLPLSVFAQVGGMANTNYSLGSISQSIANALWIVFTLIVVISFIVAGIAFLTAQGDPGKIQTARSAVVWGVVGIIVGIVAYGAITLVISILG